MYELKIQKKAPKPKPKLKELNASSTYVGKAGEYGVMSELLFWGYNPAIVSVDDGIDIIASKDNQYFHIQVKTANPRQGKSSYSYQIRNKIFKTHDNAKTFYVFVARRVIGLRHISDYLIFPSSEIRRLIEIGVIKVSKDNISISIAVDGDDYRIGRNEKVTCLNNFSSIK